MTARLRLRFGLMRSVQRGIVADGCARGSLFQLTHCLVDHCHAVEQFEDRAREVPAAPPTVESVPTAVQR